MQRIINFDKYAPSGNTLLAGFQDTRATYNEGEYLRLKNYVDRERANLPSVRDLEKVELRLEDVRSI